MSFVEWLAIWHCHLECGQNFVRPCWYLQLAMHSIREMCSVDDCSHAYNHFMSFMEDFTALDASIDVDSLEDPDILGTVEDTPCNHVQ